MKQNKRSFHQCYAVLKLGICLGLAVLAAGGGAEVGCNVAVYAADYEVFYVGTVDSNVNVRVAAGQENDQVMHNGEKVQLKPGDKVTIIGEDMVGDKVWYKVYFILDGEEITGYCTSSYVKKTDETVMPTTVPEEQKPTNMLAEGDRDATANAVDYAEVVYDGIVESNVNVRVAAGQENDLVMHNGEKVQLKAGDKVTIIGEDMAGDKVWYKVRFILDGEEIVGYCTSSYVTKTEIAVIPMKGTEEQGAATKGKGAILEFLISKWPWIVGGVVLVIIMIGHSSGSSARTSSGTGTSSAHTSSNTDTSSGTGTSSTRTYSNARAKATICIDGRHIPDSNELSVYVDDIKACSFYGGSTTRDIDVASGRHIIKFLVYNDASEYSYWLGPFEVDLEEGTEYDLYPGKS